MKTSIPKEYEHRDGDNIRILGENRWLIRYDASQGSSGNRRQRKVVFVGDKRGAEKKRRELLMERDRGLDADLLEERLVPFVEQWITEREPDLARHTYARYKGQLKNQIRPKLGDVEIGKAALRLKSFYADLQRSGGINGEGLSSTTARQCHSIIHAALETAVREGRLPYNPANRVRAPRVEKTDVRALTDIELTGLLAKLKGGRFYVPALLGGVCGLRRGEVLALRWQDVSLDRGVAVIARSLDGRGGKPSYKKPKSGKTRQVALPDIVVRALKTHHAEQAARRLALGRAYNDHDLVVCYEDGRPWPPDCFTPRFISAVKKFGYEGVHFHVLRHTAVSVMLQIGVNPKVVQEMAGHHSAAFTLDRYGHVAPSLQAEAAERVDAALRRAEEQRTTIPLTVQPANLAKSLGSK